MVISRIVAVLLETIRSLERKGEEQSYRAPLQTLIERAERRMKVKPRCPYCGGEMTFRHSAIAGVYEHGVPIRDDQAWKCLSCYHTAHFGIPITRKEALEEIKLRGGVYLTRPTFRWSERDMEQVKKRLQALGYLDF